MSLKLAWSTALIPGQLGYTKRLYLERKEERKEGRKGRREEGKKKEGMLFTSDLFNMRLKFAKRQL